MHNFSIPKSVTERIVARRGRAHIYDNLDPRKTALVVVDMQNAFMLPDVAHSLCPTPKRSCRTSIGSPRRYGRAAATWSGSRPRSPRRRSKAGRRTTICAYRSRAPGAPQPYRPEAKGTLCGRTRRAAERSGGREETVQRFHPRLVESRRSTARKQPRHVAYYRHCDRRMLRNDCARCHDAQLQDCHGHRWQRGKGPRPYHPGTTGDGRAIGFFSYGGFSKSIGKIGSLVRNFRANFNTCRHEF
jgi:hypothetical protein